MGYIGDFGKIIKGTAKSIPGNIEMASAKAGIKAGFTAAAHGASENTVDYLAGAVHKGMKYGIYGAAGAATVGAAVGLVSQDTTVMGGSLNGAGLGAIGGAGAGAVAAAIAKSIR